jgi:hypothetical protein
MYGIFIFVVRGLVCGMRGCDVADENSLYSSIREEAIK